MITEDRGSAAQSLIRYIGSINEVTELSDDREILQENLFYRNVEYIVRIPDGFMESCILGDEKLQVTTVPGTYSGYYVERQITNFINFARTYAAAGFSEEEISDAMEQRESAQVELTGQNGGGAEQAYAFYYRYLPYLILCVLCYVMGYILMGFRRGSLPDRMAASAVPARRQKLEGLLASGVIAIALWGNMYSSERGDLRKRIIGQRKSSLVFCKLICPASVSACTCISCRQSGEEFRWPERYCQYPFSRDVLHMRCVCGNGSYEQRCEESSTVSAGVLV